MENYYIALAEVDEILKYIESKFITKIPKDILEVIKNNKAPNVVFKYNITKSLIEQNVHKETLEILSYINYNFWMNESKKCEFEKKYYDNIMKKENEKRIKYNPDDLFKKINNNIEKKEVELVIVEEKNNFINKIINKIKSIFNKA